jgi:phospholipid-translocating ATPase
MALSTYEEPEEAPITTKRLRWATQRLGGKKGTRKRTSILGRLGHRGSQNSEKKRYSAGGDSLGTGTDLGGIQEEPNEDEEETPEDDDDNEGPRKVFFNIPLPREAVDEDGHPLKHYRRNKIRTAKYTPLSFVPKNIWYQFHNIANVYFLFLIILAVSRIPRHPPKSANRFPSSSASLEHPIQD